MSVDVPYLSQLKSYLKIIGIPYYSHNNLSIHLLSNNIKAIIKQNQIFDNVILVSKLCVIKVLPKSNMSIVQVDIWNIQSGSKAKGLINWCFNVGSYIITIRGMNMNLDIPQCKNCWRQNYVTFSCRIQGARCVKCSGLHKTEHHQSLDGIAK